MRSDYKQIISFVTAVAVVASVFGVSVNAATVRTAVSGNPSSGCTWVGVRGNYYTATKDKILSRINYIRYEACKKHYPSPKNGKRLSLEDYVPIKWSSDLEEIAVLRASECTVYESHLRPNGSECFTAKSSNGEKTYGECLAWNYSGLLRGIEQWYAEKEDWIRNDTEQETGHYAALISPNNKYVGISCFKQEIDNWYGVAAEFSPFKGRSESMSGISGECMQMIDVNYDAVGDIDILGEKLIKTNEATKLTLNTQVCFDSIVYGDNITNGTYNADWTCSNPDVATISEYGQLKARKNGIVTVTATYNDGSKKSVSCKVYVDNDKPTKIKTDRIDIQHNGKYITGKSVSIKKGKTAHFKAVLNPIEVTDKRVSWKSSNKKIATVNSSGTVKAKKPGKATITLTAKDGSKKTAKCKVKVK